VVALLVGYRRTPARLTGDAMSVIAASMTERDGDRSELLNELTARVSCEVEQFHWSVAALLLRSSSIAARNAQAQLCDVLVGSASATPCFARRRSTDLVPDPAVMGDLGTRSPASGVRHPAMTMCIAGVGALGFGSHDGFDQLVAAHHLALAHLDSCSLVIHPTDVAVLIALGLGRAARAMDLLDDGSVTFQRWIDVAAPPSSALAQGSTVVATRHRDRWRALRRELDGDQDDRSPRIDDSWRARYEREGQRLVSMLAGTTGSEAVPTLSPRECDIARLLLAGHTHKEIGGQLFIAAKTVEHHVARMRQRLGCVNRAEFLAALRHQGLYVCG
jgi:DNA-binding CsgD family transcriptional regulator